MNKMNKKGFTLVEMLAVIAIIAVLVSIILPVINGSTLKARAATNAANLRGVQGEMISMMLLEPDAWGRDDKRADLTATETVVQSLVDGVEFCLDALDKASLNEEEKAKFTQELKGILEETTGKDSISVTVPFVGTKVIAVEEIVDTLRYSKGVVSTVLDAADEKLNETLEDVKEQIKQLDYYTADEDGFITLDNGVKIPAPASQPISYGDIELEKGVPMTVYVDSSGKAAYAFYGDYMLDEFALIAGGKDSAE